MTETHGGTGPASLIRKPRGGTRAHTEKQRPPCPPTCVLGPSGSK